ncbi:unnamed protein product [Lathyrus oleraceus]
MLCRPYSRPLVLQLFIWSTLGCNKFQDNLVIQHLLMLYRIHDVIAV